MPAVIFVCKANRFRSPLAAAMFQKCLQAEADGKDWQVLSAGIWTEPGQAALPMAMQLAEKLGTSLRSHRSRSIDSGLLAGVNLVITMESGQREALLAEFPQLEGHVFLLSELAAGVSYDVPDLFDARGQSTWDLGEEVCHLVEQGYPAICKLAVQLASGISPGLGAGTRA